MAKGKKKADVIQKPIEQYDHKDKQRLNNPPVGLVDAHTDNGGLKKKKYAYDPHIDPSLQWAGKAEHTSFEVPTVSLHVHERIDPRKIIESIKKKADNYKERNIQPSLFEEEKKPLREAIEFYKHKENWSNRLIAGDSLLVMNSLLEKEGMGGKVQMVYFDPPYGIKYGSNFQPFVNKKDVKDGSDNDLTAEPEMIKAFRDTWELGIHSYLTYLRDRLLLANEILNESGSIFVQISDENVHLVRNLLDEIFTKENFVAQITYTKTSALGSKYLGGSCDFIIWYAKNKTELKYRQLYKERVEKTEGGTFTCVELKDKSWRRLTAEEKRGEIELPKDSRRFRAADISRQSQSDTSAFEFQFEGKKYLPSKGRHWATHIEGLKRLADSKRIISQGNTLAFKKFDDDFPFMELDNNWIDTSIGSFTEKIYVVQTGELPIKRCILMSTDPGDLVLDITCGSGTTAFVAENIGRRWIACDTSRVALTLTKQRIMAANFDYFELAYPDEGVGSGFKYETVPHITLKSIANNESTIQETLFDKPKIDNKRQRVTGPFTFEAVPAPYVKSFDEFEGNSDLEADNSIARTGETLRHNEWKDELQRTGVRGKGGALIEFTRVETLSGTHYLQADAETKEANPKRVVVCFGPEHAPLEQRMVELALEEARSLMPRPAIVLFCAFQFDEEAAKDIDEINWPGVQLLKAQMNADMFTDDLKKKRSSNESFWLIGQPDVDMIEIPSGDDKGKYQVEVRGFDYYNPKNGKVESGGKGDIAMWMLDTDYDGRSLFPSQVFFPMAGAKEGWTSLAKNLKAEIDQEKIEFFRGCLSLPFDAGKSVAIKIIDARGIESLKIIRP